MGERGPRPGGLHGIPVVRTVLPPSASPQEHGDHHMVSGVDYYRDVAELVYPVHRWVARVGAVGLAGLRGAAENFAESESELGGPLSRVRPDGPAPVNLEPLPELPLPRCLWPPRDRPSAWTGSATVPLTASSLPTGAGGTRPSAFRATRNHSSPASSPASSASSGWFSACSFSSAIAAQRRSWLAILVS